MLDVEQLYVRHRSDTRGYVVKRLRTADDDRIDDLVSDIWARVWERRHQYRDQGCDPLAWVFRIAQHTIVDEYRRRTTSKRGVSVSLTNVDAHRATADAGGDRHIDALSASVWASALLGIDTLTAEQRRVIECRFLRGLSEKETALMTGHGCGAVKKLQRRALANLRKHLGIAA